MAFECENWSICLKSGREMKIKQEVDKNEHRNSNKTRQKEKMLHKSTV